MSNTYRDCVLAGILAGLLYISTAAGLLVGILVQLLPIVPLFWAGFRFGATGQAVASAVAYGLFAFAANMEAAILIGSLQGLPALVLTHFSAKWALSQTGERFPLPMGNVLTYVILYGIFFFAVLSFFLGQQGTSLAGILSQDVKASEGLLDPGLQLQLETTAKHYPFIMYGLFGWVWTLMIYATAWVSHLMTETFWRVKRDSMRIDPFTLSPWVPLAALMAACAGSASGPEGKALFYTATLLFGFLYFIYGVAMIHATIRSWKNPMLWYWGLYLLLVFTYWPAMLIAAYGLGHHLALFVGVFRGNSPKSG